MRKILLTLCTALLVSSCGQKDDKKKDSDLKIETIGPTEDTSIKNSDTSGKQSSDSTKTMKMTFIGYEEGDYAHLLFKETGTGTEYDFGHPDDNKLNEIQVVLKDKNTSFGYKANKKMAGAKYIVDVVYRMTDTYDGNGQPMKGKEWRITGLKKDE